MRLKNLPIFFPDATRAVVRSLDAKDLKDTNTRGVLVNTLHLKNELGENPIKNGVKDFMNWDGFTISDSGGFQVYSMGKAKGLKNFITDDGVYFEYEGKKKLFTPEDSIKYQAKLKTDLMVVLDDFTPPDADYKSAEKTVERTIDWAKRSKKEYEKTGSKAMLCAVAQGGKYKDLRIKCIEDLTKIGFDAMGYGGWPMDENNNFDYKTAKIISDTTPDDYLLYGLGIGKPEDIVGCYKLGYEIFDCVLPSRDARHGRLYVYKADSINEIDITKNEFYEYYYPKKANLADTNPVSKACDCLLCKEYSRGYLKHLYKIQDTLYFRLATIHNLRFYSLLMERLARSSAK